MTHASLFSGIGGPEVAAEMLGLDNLFHCEINEFGRKILDYWFPKSKSYEDITKTDFSEWRGKVDVLTGGFPCQPFSYAGKRGGANDDRYLWPQMLRVIDEIRPTWVVGENVAGITTMVEPGEVSTMGTQTSLFGTGDDIQRYQYRQPFTIERICKDIESLGYAVQPVLIPACGVGAPHRRDRVFIVARRVEAVSEDSMHSRQLYGQDEVEGSERNERNTCAGSGERLCRETSGTDIADPSDARAESMRRERQDAVHGFEPTPHPDSHRGCEVDEHMESELANGAKSVSNGGQRNVADTNGEQGNGNEPEQSEIRRKTQEQLRRRGCEDGCVAGCGRWQNFPSVSPVHRGNDGLPFYVDRLTIPFSKWRTESLKAYGNAIVPQVMYEIFRAIDIITTKTIYENRTDRC